MPAPQAAQIESIAKAALASAGIRGELASALASALAQITADALEMFVSQAQVLPGIPAAAPPPAGAGATVGPGTLAGGPGASRLEPLARLALTKEGIQGDEAGALAKVIAGALAQGIALFTAQVQVAPGIAIAGFVTVAPGRLL